MSNVDPDNLPSFKLPPSLIEKLYEFTGDAHDSSKGILIAYTDQKGSPMIYTKCGSPIIDMGIRKALEKYLIEIEGADMPFDINEKE
jgi:hypothetical protein